MTWSYSGDPADSNLDAIRFETGDTDSTDPLLTDEEIAYAISAESTTIGAAARCCEAIAKKYAREADWRLGPQAVSASQRSAAYSTLAKELRARVIAMNAPTMADPSSAAFERGMMSNYDDRPAEMEEDDDDG